MRAGKLANSTFERDWQAFMRQYGGRPQPRDAHVVARCLAVADWKLLYTCRSSRKRRLLLWPSFRLGGPLGTQHHGEPEHAGRQQLPEHDPRYGTSWGPPVMPTTLNDFTGSGFYEAVDADDSQTDNTHQPFESDLLTDINPVGQWSSASTRRQNAGPISSDTRRTSRSITGWQPTATSAPGRTSTTMTPSMAPPPSRGRDVTSPSSKFASSNMWYDDEPRGGLRVGLVRCTPAHAAPERGPGGPAPAPHPHPDARRPARWLRWLDRQEQRRRRRPTPTPGRRRPPHCRRPDQTPLTMQQAWGNVTVTRSRRPGQQSLLWL